MRFFSLILTVTLILLLVFATRWFTRTPAHLVSQRIKQTGLVAVGILLILLVITGRLPWLFALLGGLLPALSRLWMLKRAYQSWRANFGKKPSPNQSHHRAGQTSTITTQFLSMNLDHDSGDLDGRVIQGEYADYKLSELKKEQLIKLLVSYRTRDHESAQVLEAYLDRRFGEAWDAPDEQKQSQSMGGESEMTLSEAYSILGLGENAGIEQIKQSHRRLMQKCHPDRGGSDYLAAKVNQAKDRLLKANK